MDQAALFGRSQRTRHLHAHLQRHRRRQRTESAQARLERFSFHKLHRIKAVAKISGVLRTGQATVRLGQRVERAEMINTGHVCLAETSRRLRFVEKTAPRIGAGRELSINDL